MLNCVGGSAYIISFILLNNPMEVSTAIIFMSVDFEVQTSDNGRTRAWAQVWLHTPTSYHCTNCFDTLLGREEMISKTLMIQKRLWAMDLNKRRNSSRFAVLQWRTCHRLWRWKRGPPAKECSPRSWKSYENQFSPRASRRNAALLTLWF